jgi:PIN domain nuclease of toxin-antitoxin system
VVRLEYRADVRLLLDTHIVLWSLTSPERIGERARAMIETARGRLRTPDGFHRALWESGFDELPWTAAHADRLRELPLHHMDPCDRLLVAQAQSEGLALMTVGQECMAYDVDVVDARP